MKLRKGSSSEENLPGLEYALMVSLKDLVISVLMWTRSFCFSSAKAEEIPVNPV
jgi:hypothetical protein